MPYGLVLLAEWAAIGLVILGSFAVGAIAGYVVAKLSK